ncbi:acVLRF1 family peptidyl-tRNA hydrolase [Occultella kanbiaonis]|uniref:acVLRF1 family peptidyl-tRNA hydrolase n=1 Tax=Occultella kanbiaonis TaxID=2675754 RepID=UPI0012B6DDB2|nr:acVLRF1 family peptidyl-tRNA hydrolase [Occultella kanbiaonis]
MPAQPERRVEVPGARVGRWVAGFGERHGGAEVVLGGGPGATVGDLPGPDGVTLLGADGATAALTAWPGEPPTALADVPGWAHGPTDLVLILVRRGGYAVGRAHGADLLAHKSGTRYVQSRTAAGGWSQQRFARRRGNQADELVTAVVGHVVRILGEHALPAAGAGSAGMVLGGDRALAAQVLEDPRLTVLTDLPRRSFHDVPDPRLRVLSDVLDRARGLQITLREPAVG